MSITVHDAIVHFKSFVGKPRKSLPWLRGRQYLYDCAAAYCYIVGYHPSVTTCHELVAIFKKNGTWTTDLHKVTAGMAVIFDWEHGAGLGHNTNTDHVGLVTSVDVKNGIVRYVSADSTKTPPPPGLVTNNQRGVSSKWITGFGSAVKFDAPAAPALHPVSSPFHNGATVTLPEGQPTN
jgi:hypothetical protein